MGIVSIKMGANIASNRSHLASVDVADARNFAVGATWGQNRGIGGKRKSIGLLLNVQKRGN